MAQTAPEAPETPKASKDWTTQAADRIEAVVATVRDKTTVPAQRVARIAVFGLVASAMAVMAALLLLVGLFRLHVYLPFDHEGTKVWVTDVGAGAIFVLFGGLLWRKRKPRRKE